MFTHNSVELEHFHNRFDLDVLNNCMFSFVGKIPTALDQRLVACTNSEYVSEALASHGISGIICPKNISNLVPDSYGLAVSPEPLASLYSIHRALVSETDHFWKNHKTDISPTASIHPTAFVAKNNVTIGSGSVIGPFTVIEERTVIRDDCRIGPHCFLGGDGFDLDTTSDAPKILPHAGGVLLEKNVELQSHCVVARSTFGGFTKIGNSSKLDCLTVVTHDAQIGNNVIVAGGVTVCGRAEISDNVVLGPHCVVSNGVRVGNSASVSIGAVVTQDVPPNGKVTGNLATPHKQWMKFQKSIIAT